MTPRATTTPTTTDQPNPREDTMNETGALAAALTIGVAVIAAQSSHNDHQPITDTADAVPAAATASAPDPTGGGDVIVGVHSTGSRGDLTHYAECAANADAEPAYEVKIDESAAYGDIEGQPCPDGPHRPTARQRNPELYEELRQSQLEPLEFAGGDLAKPCGTWETSIPEAARQLAAECGPLTRGVLSTDDTTN